ncbi:mPR-typeG-protein-coupled receptor [Thozetella sp. PMI_491]|nr:mPR-typeG-protein-coupled receptor [Thozetella sp. PMI_491]
MAPTPRLRVSSPHERQNRSAGSTAPSRNSSSSNSGPRSGRSRRPVLISFEELPEWHQDNEYIRHGYRPISGSARVSFGSWKYLHNESMNIWTHLIPLVVFLLGEWYIVQFLTSRYPGITGTSIFIFVFYILTASACLGFSVMYHTLMNHSHKVEKLWLRMDLVGIMILLLGLFVSAIYMIFWCEPTERIIYWSMASQNSTHSFPIHLFRVRSINFDLDLQIGILGSFTIFIMANPKYQVRKYRTFRALIFVTTGMTGYAPLIHGCILFGGAQMMKQSGMPYYVAHGGLVLLGTLLYALKLPESRWPGRFDIVGSSHQIFHVLVVMSMTIHLTGILQAFDYNYHNRTCHA